MKTLSRWLIITLVASVAVACGDDETDPEGLDINETANNVEPNSSSPNGTTNNGGTENNSIISPNPAVETVLATSASTGQSGFSTQITFDVPEGTQSLTITIVGERDVTYTLGSWRNGPDGEFVVPQNWYQQSQFGPALCLTCPNRVVSSSGAFAAMLPVNPVLDVVPGEHAITVFTYAMDGFNIAQTASEFELEVVAKVLDDRPDNAEIDVNFFFTGAGGWTAETAPDDPAFQEVLATVDETWGQVGVTLGNMTYNDISSDFQVIEGAPEGDLPDLFATSEGASSDAVNLFFVDELIGGGPLGSVGTILGVSGGIPGPASANGSFRSGVALVVEPPPEIPTPIGLVFAHEVGHYLGLSHTSENAFAGQTHDQLDDTPENDPSYLMHNEGRGDKMSPSQGVVMRLNPWARNEGGEQ